jgi:hypothetical protein
MRKMKKFSEGGKTDRAERMRERRMADIEKDYQKALAKGKSEKEARAKRDQRIADAKDDYAKRTGADRTETRAAEKAAEARLSAARRSPDKDMKAVSVASEAPSRKPLVDTSVKAETPNFAAAPAAKAKAKASMARKTVKKDAPKAPSKADAPPKVQQRKDAAAPMVDRMANYRRAKERQLEEAARKRTSQLMTGPLPDVSKMAERERAARRNAEAQQRVAAMGLKPAKFAKGGKIDGIAIRGKTKLKRNK